MKKFIFLAGLAIGFVVGSRAGRGPYESLERTARHVADDPEVQRRASQAKDTATKAAHDTAGAVKEKAPEVASNVQGAVAGAAGSAKERLSSARDDHKDDHKGEQSGDDTSSNGTHAGGDAEVGEDKPLSS